MINVLFDGDFYVRSLSMCDLRNKAGRGTLEKLCQMTPETTCSLLAVKLNGKKYTLQNQKFHVVKKMTNIWLY